MRPTRRLALLPAVAALATLIQCTGGGSNTAPPPPPSDGGTDGAADVPDGSATGYYETEQDKPLVPANKVDLLFVVDNSASMGDKQVMLSTQIGRVLRRFIEPSAEHAPIGDIHVGVISTSLGTQGGNVCDPTNPRVNDQARLLNVSRQTGKPVVGAEKGFLSYGPGAITDVAVLEQATTEIVIGVDQTGCGLEAQLESMYRFLAAPDPALNIVVDGGGLARYEGIDEVLLAQRAAFLRPDSAVVVVMITDEDDSNVDPMSMGGQGWAFAAKEFPGSKVFRGNPRQGTTAPRGTTTCSTNPGAIECRSCGLTTCPADDPGCAAAKEDPNCKQSGQQGQSGAGYDGYYAAGDDELNVRFHRMKERYGVDPQFPLERYVRALTNRRIPNRDAEHPLDQNGKPGPYVHAPKCTNPLFAAGPLPANKDAELCNLPEGNRSRELVFFGLIGGVPHQLLNGIGGRPGDWRTVVGADPDAYDLAGIDPHMIQSTSPRQGLEGPAPRGQNGADPIHGREWDTNKADLQYACTFALPPSMQRACTASDVSCECSADDTRNPPLCDANNVQVRAKSYPTPRELRVARALGERAIVGSICPPDPSVGYARTLDAIASRVSSSLVK